MPKRSPLDSTLIMTKKNITLFLFTTILLMISCNKSDNNHQSQGTYYYPSEEAPHEGTWLVWPHSHYFGQWYMDKMEPSWIEITKALTPGEMVHIVAYDEASKQRITELLTTANVDLKRVDFLIIESDDIWARDMGPIFAYDKDGQLTILGFRFNGYGEEFEYAKDALVSKTIAQMKGIPYVPIPMVLEGGAVELDGAGTLMAARSSILNPDRNPGLTQEKAEEYFREYYGVTNFIWLEGVYGEDETDAHIDGTARFCGDNTIVTTSYDDFFELYDGILESDYTILKNAKNAKGEPYKIVELPMTKLDLPVVDYKECYMNYYIGNTVVLVSTFNDEHDAEAIRIIGGLYPNKTIVPIDSRALSQHGGMIHCVTQQQPINR